MQEKKHKQAARLSVRLAAGAIALFIAAAVLALAEAGLRIAGCGYPPEIVVPCIVDGRPAFHANEKFGWRFFPRAVARSFPPFVFSREKGDSVCRIVVVGSSAAMGDPDPAFSFWRIMDVLLCDQYPQTRFEVVPLAMVAVNSHACREMVRQARACKPDLLIVYMGNNEVIGPYGAGATMTPLIRTDAGIRLNIALQGTRLGQCAAALMHKSDTAAASRTWMGLEMFLDRPLRSDDEGVLLVRRRFRQNLEAMRRDAAASGAQTVFCTVASNLRDNPPFGSLHAAGISRSGIDSWDQLYRQGREFERQGMADSALARYRAAAAIDSTHAGLRFCMAACMLRTGDTAAATQHFVAARDLDAFRFRADSDINRIIREVATIPPHPRIRLLDAEAALAAASPAGVCGSEMFLEHVHFTFHGNYSLATALVQQVPDLLPKRLAGTSRRKPLLTEQGCVARMMFSAWDRQQILRDLLQTRIRRPPFTGQLGNDSLQKKLSAEMEELQRQLTPQLLQAIAQSYDVSLALHPDDVWLNWKYGDFLLRGLNRPDAAETRFRYVIRRFPCYADARAALGETLGRLGNVDAAIDAENSALKLSPYNVYARYNLGLAWLLQKKYADAAAQFRMAVAREPFHEAAWNNLGASLTYAGKYSEAVEAYRAGLRMIPQSEELRLNCATVLLMQGRRDEAKEEIKIVVANNPASNRALVMLQRLDTNYKNIK